MIRRLLLSAGVALMALGALAQSRQGASPVSARPWMNRSLSPRRRAELLVGRMTLDEKILEIHMMNTKQHPREVAAILRLGIPALKITNGPAGAGPGDSPQPQPATALPSALALAGSWDPALAETFGRLAAAEVADRGEDVIEGPGLNITRVPQNGRNFEYFGEDPYLSARMGVAEVRGIQSRRVIAEIKHFDANNQETDRKTINEVIPLRALQEIYLPAFRAAVTEAHAGAVMCAYPSVNGEFNCQNRYLLAQVLRRDWGFEGFVQSDYTATHSTIRSALAGLDLEMKHDAYYGSGMKAAVTSGELPVSVLNALLVRRFGQMFRFGLFDRPHIPKPIPARQDGAIARAIAEQCAVLLKNAGNELPLDPASLRSVALVGPYAAAASTGGGGSSAVTPLYTVTPREGLERALGPRVKVHFNDGSDPAAAAAIARQADLAVVMVGNKDSEGHDRPDLSLPGDQDALISAVAAANPKTIVVLKTGGPVLMPWRNRVAAILEVWYPGEEDGNAVANLLVGKVDPSGKLPMTFPRAASETPAHTPEQYPGVNGTVVYSEGLEVGYRWYDAQHVAPLFPFGFGLSYTTFRIGNLRAPHEVSGNAPGSVSLDVANTGSRAGAEVVQVYVAAPPAAGEPPQQLKGFAKIALRPGETRRAVIPLDPRAFSIWNAKLARWSVVPGNYEIFAGDSSRDLTLHREVFVCAPARRPISRATPRREGR